MPVESVVSQISTAALATGAVTAAVIATDAIDSDAIATSAVTEIVGSVVNTNGTATLAAVLGDPRGTDIASLLFNLGAQKVAKGITFNAATSYAAFTVTGTVAVKVVGVVSGPLTNDAFHASVGTATDPVGLIAETAGTAMQTMGQIWVDATPSKIKAFPTGWTIISESIIVTADAGVAGGVVGLNCWWFPVVAASTLVPAAV